MPNPANRLAAVDIDGVLVPRFEVLLEAIAVFLFGIYPWNQVKKLPAGIIKLNDRPLLPEYFDAAAG